MSWVMAGVASAQLTYSVYKGIKAKNSQDDADDAAKLAIENYQKIETRNVMGALQIPTKGIELEERNLARATAGQVEAMQETGAAGVIGGTGRLTQAVGAQSENQAARIDKMQAERDKIVLTEEQSLERERANRLRNVELMRLQGAQGASAQAYNEQQAAIQSGVQAVGTIGTSVVSAQNPYGSQSDSDFTSSGDNLAPWAPPGTTTTYNSLGQPVSSNMHDWMNTTLSGPQQINPLGGE